MTSITLTRDQKAVIEAATDTLEKDTFRRIIASFQPKQESAYDLSVETGELLFGGAAGGGKSYWLCAYAISEMLRVPQNVGIIFRRVMPSLRRTILIEMKRLIAEFDVPARYNAVTFTYYFENGSILELAQLQHEDSVRRYQGAQFGFVAFEELTEFIESQYLYMLSRLRAPVAGARPRLVSTANPGGEGHKWVQRRFLKPPPAEAPDGVEVGVPWAPVPAEGQEQGLSRVYVQSLLDDNPILLKRDPSYRAALASIADRRLRKAMQTGDWDALNVVDGALCLPTWVEIKSYGTREDLAYICIGVDPSGSVGRDDVGIVAAGLDDKGRYFLLDDITDAYTPAGWAEATWSLFARYQANAIALEVNFGGRMAESVLLNGNTDEHEGVIHMVNSSRGKYIRAEFMGSLFDPHVRDPDMERRLFFGKEMDDLANEWTGWKPGTKSPNRLDASVFATAYLKEFCAGAGAAHGLNWLS